MTEEPPQVPSPFGRHAAADQSHDELLDQAEPGTIASASASAPGAPQAHSELPHDESAYGGRHSHALHADADTVEVSFSAGRDPYEMAATAANQLDGDGQMRASVPRRPWPLGLIAAALTIVLIALQIVALSLTASGQFGPATVLGEILAYATVLPLVVGVLAIIQNRGRGLAIAAVIVAVLTNPLILITLLELFSSF